MTEVNLLPDNLRGKEKKEKKSKKGSSVSDIKFSLPKSEKKNKKLKKSFFSGFFNRKKKLKNKKVNKTENVIKSPSILTSETSVKVEKSKIKKKFKKKVFKPQKTKKSFLKSIFEPKVKKKKNLLKTTKQDLPVLSSLVEKKHSIPKIKKIKEKEKLVKMDKFLSANLMPEDTLAKAEANLSKRLIISTGMIILSVLLIITGYMGLTWYQMELNKNINTLGEQISLLDAQIIDYEKGEYKLLETQEKLKHIRGLLDNHVYWTQFFEMMEKYTINEVYYTGYQMAGSDQLFISAVGLDYESVAKQYIAFQKAENLIKDISITSAQANIGEGLYLGVNFDIQLTFYPAVFLNPLVNQKNNSLSGVYR